MIDHENLHQLKATIWIGKYGCSDGIIDEIRHQLKKRKMVKVRWLRNADINPEQIAHRSNARIVQIRGRTLILAELREKSHNSASRNI